MNIDSPQDAKIWVDLLTAKFIRKEQLGKGDFDRVLGNCMAVSDVPCITFWQELMDAYPEAKILITTRDNEQAWYDSFMNSSIRLLGPIYNDGWLSRLR